VEQIKKLALGQPAYGCKRTERFFTLLAEKQLPRGVRRSTRDLQQAIFAYIDTVNADPRPFRWTKFADDILSPPPSLSACTHLISPKNKLKSSKLRNQDMISIAQLSVMMSGPAKCRFVT